MRTSESSMDLIEKSEKMVVIGSECGYGLKSETMKVETKRCGKCGKVLPVSDFNKNKKAKDGLQSHCRECHKEVMREYHIKCTERELGISLQDKNSIKVASVPQNLTKVYAHADLSRFTPRQLMEELKARGFKWDWMLEPQRKIYFDKI